MTQSKWAEYNDKILQLYRENSLTSYTEAARSLLGEDADGGDVDLLRTYIRRFLVRQQSNTSPYKETIYDKDALKKYCEEEGLDISKVKSVKYVNHAGQQKFNVVLDYGDVHEEIDWEAIRELLRDELSSWDVSVPKSVLGRTGVVKISDLHLGAHVSNLIKTNDFNSSILKKQLEKSVKIVNSHNYDTVHVHILGDLIESFTGLNHKNSWKNIERGLFGAEAVKLVTKLLASYLSKIENLGKVMIVGGNHDRTTSDSKEDVEGGAANLVAWGLGLVGFDVSFDAIVLKHVVDGICHINTHGHHGISRMTTGELCWQYGMKGMFNYVSEGHLHSRIEKLSSKKNFSTVRDDSVDHKRVISPSFFMGNLFSESNGWSSNAGFQIVEDNGEGKPNTFDYSL